MINYKGIGGISRDLPDRDTPPDFVHVAQNVTASHGVYAAAFGFRTIQQLPELIYHMQPLSDSQWEVYLLLGATKAYSWQGNTVADITNDGEDLVPLIEGEKYSSDTINGMGVFAQKNDYPRAYGNPTNAQEKVQYLPYNASGTWADENLKTGIIRNYKNYIVTLGEKSAGGEDGRKVRWSASVTDTGVLPYWEPLPENDAGFVTLADLETEIVEGRQLGDAFIIYSHNSAYSMQWVGGQNIMRFQRLNNLPGVMKKNLVMPFENTHFVIGQTDIYIHSGGAPQSVVDQRIREPIYAKLNSENLEWAFLVKNWQMQEIWLCTGDTDGATIAFAWNWKDNTWTTRPIPKSFYGVAGITPVEHMTYDTMPYPNYDSIPGTYTGLGPKEANLPEVVFSTLDQTLSQRDTGVLEDVGCDCLIERHGLSLGEYDEIFTLITAYPQISKAPVTLQFGMQMHEDAGIDWSKPQVFDPTKDKHVDLRGDNLSGSLFCLRIYNESPALFEYTGVSIKVARCGSD